MKSLHMGLESCWCWHGANEFWISFCVSCSSKPFGVNTVKNFMYVVETLCPSFKIESSSWKYEATVIGTVKTKHHPKEDKLKALKLCFNTTKLRD